MHWPWQHTTLASLYTYTVLLLHDTLQPHRTICTGVSLRIPWPFTGLNLGCLNGSIAVQVGVVHACWVAKRSLDRRYCAYAPFHVLASTLFYLLLLTFNYTLGLFTAWLNSD